MPSASCLDSIVISPYVPLSGGSQLRGDFETGSAASAMTFVLTDLALCAGWISPKASNESDREYDAEQAGLAKMKRNLTVSLGSLFAFFHIPPNGVCKRPGNGVRAAR